MTRLAYWLVSWRETLKLRYLEPHVYRTVLERLEATNDKAPHSEE